MAEYPRSSGKLHVSKGHLECGHKRHHVSCTIRIPFEAHYSIPGSYVGDDSPVINTNSHESIAWPASDADDMDPDPVEGSIPDVDGATWTETAGDDDDTSQGTTGEFVSNPGGARNIPRIAKWRLNLTALSQVHNIYMVAYRNSIMVSRPSSCVTSAFAVFPTLVLDPPASEASQEVGGYMDTEFPHQVNRLIVGDLGHEEILLLAYDDGDIIAYYTRHIESEMQRCEEGGRRAKILPQPFFHENVGMTAWGLAVHKESRLIAASCNLSNVSVFAFALAGESYEHDKETYPAKFFTTIWKDAYGDMTAEPADCEFLSESKASSLESIVHRRDINWRIVLQTSGDNIPNISFSDDEDGKADKIVAVDIMGDLWIMDIWHLVRHPHVKLEKIHWRFDHWHSPRGWGVLVLPESSFLPTDESFMDSVGLPPQEAIYITDNTGRQWIDTSDSILHVQDNSIEHPWVRHDREDLFEINPHDAGNGSRHLPELSWRDFAAVAEVPACNMVDKSLLSQPKAAVGRIQSDAIASQPKPVLKDGSSILRTYELDIELCHRFQEGGSGVMCEGAIDQDRPSHSVLRSVMASCERLANLAHVPELSLVVAGSMCGRVALVTLTRPAEGAYSFDRGFKIEAILPRKSEEEVCMRPMCPLLGLAVGPMPRSDVRRSSNAHHGSKRYRLMLHYYDLTILSYELSRDPVDNHLSFF
ncbi:hypothetical protein GGR52DRAFT_537613 [Hypoxylon sp. FL1284]|nr:hypothetical protein GGR52DRAFT_537613 [Hypoxylon sp. FL1284]